MRLSIAMLLLMLSACSAERAATSRGTTASPFELVVSSEQGSGTLAIALANRSGAVATFNKNHVRYHSLDTSPEEQPPEPISAPLPLTGEDLSAGSTARWSLPIDPGTSPGRYALRLRVATAEGDVVTVESNAFAVGG